MRKTPLAGPFGDVHSALRSRSLSGLPGGFGSQEYLGTLFQERIARLGLRKGRGMIEVQVWREIHGS